MTPQAEAYAIAKQIVIDALKAQGLKINWVARKDIEQAINDILAADPSILAGVIERQQQSVSE
jgi:hypothetical protein